MPNPPYKFDFFISHASEQKETIVIPLKELLELQKPPFKVWVDKYQIDLGDNLVQKINDGLRDSEYCIFIISPEFLGKNWPVAELCSMLAKQINTGRKQILPFYYGMSYEQLCEAWPLLAPYISVSIDGGPESVLEIILKAVSGQQTTAFGPKAGEQSKNYYLNGRATTIPCHLTHIPPVKPEEIFGREADLQKLEAALASGSQQVALVNGIGGIGKSTLARLYVHKRLSDFVHIAWIDNVSNFRSSLALNEPLCQSLGLSFGRDDDENSRYHAIINHLKLLDRPSLLVVDNADAELAEQLQFLPGSPQWVILATSRMQLHGFKDIPLDVLPQKAARDLFYLHYKQQPLPDEPRLNHFLDRLGRHALLIELIAKAAQKRGLSFEELEAKYKAQKFDFSPAKINTDYQKTATPQTVLDIIREAFDFSELDENENRLLLQFALLPAVPHSLPMLMDLVQYKPEEEKFLYKLLEDLTYKGWLTEEEDKSWKCHQVIQEALLQQKGTIKMEDCHNLVDSIGRKLKMNPNSKDYKIPTAWIKHGEALMEKLDLLEKDFAWMLVNLGFAYGELANFDAQISTYQKSLDINIQLFGNNNENVATLYNNLGGAWASKGDYNKAIAFYDKALSIDLVVLGENHPNLAIRYNNLGNAWDRKGYYDKAIAFYDQALSIDLEVLGENHPSTARDFNNLGSAWEGKGDFDKAIAFYDKALSIDLAVFGENHPKVAIRYNNLGSSWSSKGDYNQAIAFYEKALSIDLAVFGENHPNIAIRYNNLGGAWSSKGNYDQAIAYFEKAVSIDLAVLGENHPNLAKRYNHLGNAWFYKSRFDKAIIYFDQALKILRNTVGEAHPHYQITTENLRLAREAAGKE